MPGIFLIPIVVFALSLARSTGQDVKVVHIEDGQVVQERRIQAPLLIVKDGDSISVRSAHARGNRGPSLNLGGNMFQRNFNELDFNDWE